MSQPTIALVMIRLVNECAWIPPIVAVVGVDPYSRVPHTQESQ